MNRFENGDSIGPQLLILRIITFALMFGVAVFTGVVIWQGALSLPPQGSVLTSAGIVGAAIALGAQFFIPVLFQTPRQADAGDEQFLQLFLTRHIVSIAIPEGAAFLNATALQTEHNWWSLLIVGVLLLAILIRWPTRTRLEQFLETARMEASI